MPSPQSTHRVTRGWRWFIALTVVPLVGLMAWGILEVIGNYRSGNPNVTIWIALPAIAMMGGLSIVFICGAIWAFRGNIEIEGDRMTLRGVFRTTVVTPDRVRGFRVVNHMLSVYLVDRRLALQIGYVNDLHLIRQWLEQHTTDLLGDMLAEEDAGISADVGLGFSEAEKEQRLAALRRLVRKFNVVVYVTAGAVIVNALFLHHDAVEKVGTFALMLAPLCLVLIALSNRGHVRIDYDEGSRYPQIFSAVFAAGIVLMLLALFDRGALLDEGRFYRMVTVAVVVNALIWLFIDAERLRTLRKRGMFALAMTVFAFILLPATWLGGGLYFANKHLDTSTPEWHLTRVVGKKKKSGKVTTYYVTVAGWSGAPSSPVEVQVRRADYDDFEAGQAARIGVRRGGLHVIWVSDLEPGTR